MLALRLASSNQLQHFKPKSNDSPLFFGNKTTIVDYIIANVTFIAFYPYSNVIISVS